MHKEQENHPVLNEDGLFDPKDPQNVKAIQFARSHFGDLKEGFHKSGLLKEAVDESGLGEEEIQRRFEFLIDKCALVLSFAFANDVPAEALKVLGAVLRAAEERTGAVRVGQGQFEDDREEVHAHGEEELADAIMAQSVSALKAVLPTVAEELDEFARNASEDDAFHMVLMVTGVKDLVREDEDGRMYQMGMSMRSFTNQDAPKEIVRAMDELYRVTDPRRPNLRARSKRIDTGVKAADFGPDEIKRNMREAREEAKAMLERLRKKGQDGGAS